MAKGDGIIATEAVQQVRLDCLRVAAQRLDLDPERVVERARVFEKYVAGAATPSRSATSGKEPKGDNPLS